MTQAAAVKAKGRKNAIGDFYVGMIDEKVMHAYLKGTGTTLPDADGMNAEQLALALVTHFRSTTNRDDMCKCNECDGEAPETVSPCPYCGFDAPITEGGDADGDPSPELGDPPAPVTSVTTKKSGKKGKPDKMVKTTAPKANGAAAMAPKKGGELVHLKGKGEAMLATKLTVKDLDKAVAEVEALKQSASDSMVELGHKMLEIMNAGIWKLRIDGDKPRWAGFDAFCESELGINKNNAYEIMRTAKQYSPEYLALIGKKKLTLILRAPPEDRAALEEAAEKGASKRELAENVKKLREEKGYTGETAREKAGAKGGKKSGAKKKAAKAATEKPAKDKITIANIEGSRTIKLFAKPASMRNIDLAQCKPAKAIGDQPFGILELTNEVTQQFFVRKGKNGTIELRIDTRRAGE